MATKPEFHWLWYIKHYSGEHCVQLYLLGHEVQPALQSVGHFDLPVVIVHFHAAAAVPHTQLYLHLLLHLLHHIT